MRITNRAPRLNDQQLQLALARLEILEDPEGQQIIDLISRFGPLQEGEIATILQLPSHEAHQLLLQLSSTGLLYEAPGSLRYCIDDHRLAQLRHFVGRLIAR